MSRAVFFPAPCLPNWLSVVLLPAVTSTEGKTCNSTNSRWEGKGDICRCKAGYLQQGDYTSTTEPSCIRRFGSYHCLASCAPYFVRHSFSSHTELRLHTRNSRDHPGSDVQTQHTC